MQCAVVLQVGLIIKQIKTKHVQNFLILSSLSHMYISMNVKKIFWAQQNLTGHCPGMPSWLGTFVPVFQWKVSEVVYIGSNHVNVARYNIIHNF